MRTEKKQKLAQLRRWRVRKKVSGTKERPRMSVCFTNENIYVQFIDDAAGVTLAAASTTSKATPGPGEAGRQREPARKPSARWRRRPRWTRASSRWCSTAAARVITARSKRWPMPRAKPGLQF